MQSPMSKLTHKPSQPTLLLPFLPQGLFLNSKHLAHLLAMNRDKEQKTDNPREVLLVRKGEKY